MLITIKTTDKELETSLMLDNNEKDACYPEVVSSLMGAMEAYCSKILENVSDKEKQEVHDYMSAVFSVFMQMNFPDTVDFGLSDAAVIMAQDQIIEQALKDGVPVEEAVAKYNQKAADYYKERKHAEKVS